MDGYVGLKLAILSIFSIFAYKKIQQSVTQMKKSDPPAVFTWC